VKNWIAFGLMVGFIFVDRLIVHRLGDINRVWTVGDREIVLELADTPQALEKGLGGRANLERDRGMLFSLDRAHSVVVWMAEMNFPIDVIFLKDDRVVEIRRKLPVCVGECREFYLSPGDTNGFIEFNAGQADELGLKVGDKLAIAEGRQANGQKK
jgi:uncharacterized protein